MRLPNGFGSVYKLSGKRRRPYVARKTVGWKTVGKKSYPVYNIIGYYEKYAAALEALIDYNKNPYDLDNNITFGEIYEKWSDDKYSKISQSNINAYKAAYKLCNSICDMKFTDIKLSHLQAVVDNSGKNYPTLRKLKTLFSALYDYAIKNEIVTKDRDLVQYVDISAAGNPNAYDRKPFTSDELNRLWEEKDNEYVQIILMLIYNGCRISEFLNLKTCDVNINEQYFDIVKSKTDAGIRRVPIADKVLPFFKFWYNKGNKYLITTPDGEHFKYRNYYDSYWTPIMDMLSMDHTPHCTRHTCISLLTAKEVDERFIQKIVGHKGQNVTQIVYTHLEIQELLRVINLI